MEFFVPCIAVIAVFFANYVIHAEEECIRSFNNEIKCYNCVSTSNEHCLDPFNKSSRKVPLSICSGCCVKIVQFDNTPNKTITRTCTKNLKINLFMVDHVCMLESNGQGHTCFCEEEECNGGPSAKLAGSAAWQFAVGLGLVSATLLYI